MLATRDITLLTCHLPDEYVDSAISFGTETSENQELPSAKDILTSLLPLCWLRNTKPKEEQSHAVMVDFRECHLPDAYIDVPVLLSRHYDDDSDTSESEGLPSVKDLLSFNAPSHWFRSNNGLKRRHSNDLAGTHVVMTLNECHLPGEYVDAIVSYDSSGISEESMPLKDLIESLVTAFPWFGSNGNATSKKTPHATTTNNFLMLNDCHLPDAYCDVVLCC